MKNEFKSFLKTVGSGEGDRCYYPTRLDIYGKGCEHNCSYCVDGNTLILMYDSTFKKIKNVNVGDEIYGIKKGDVYSRIL
jgi:organic radical activating enzyme